MDDKTLPRPDLRALASWFIAQPLGHQVADADLDAFGIVHSHRDDVRLALTRAATGGQNFFLRLIARLMGKLGLIVDALLQILLFVVIFLIALELPYIDWLAERQLNLRIEVAEVDRRKYKQIADEVAAVLAINRIELPANTKELSPRLASEMKRAERWLKYKGKRFSQLRTIALKDADAAKDLLELYRVAWDEFVSESQLSMNVSAAKSPFASSDDELTSAFMPLNIGVPLKPQNYLQALIFASTGVLLYILIMATIKTNFAIHVRRLALYRELAKAISRSS